MSFCLFLYLHRHLCCQNDDWNIDSNRNDGKESKIFLKNEKFQLRDGSNYLTLKWEIKVSSYLLWHLKGIKLRLKVTFIGSQMCSLGCTPLNSLSANLTWGHSCSFWDWELFWEWMVQNAFTHVSSGYPRQPPKAPQLSYPNFLTGWKQIF